MKAMNGLIELGEACRSRLIRSGQFFEADIPKSDLQFLGSPAYPMRLKSNETGRCERILQVGARR